MILYGLKNCDTCRKAVKSLGEKYDVTFHDVRNDPLDRAQITGFVAAFGDALVNKSSTTWRGLSDDERAKPMADLLASYPALMKRPVIVEGEKTTLGWTAPVQSGWGI